MFTRAANALVVNPHNLCAKTLMDTKVQGWISTLRYNGVCGVCGVWCVVCDEVQGWISTLRYNGVCGVVWVWFVWGGSQR